MLGEGEGVRVGIAGVAGGAMLAALTTSLYLQSGLLYDVRVS